MSAPRDRRPVMAARPYRCCGLGANMGKPKISKRALSWTSAGIAVGYRRGRCPSADVTSALHPATRNVPPLAGPRAPPIGKNYSGLEKQELAKAI